MDIDEAIQKIMLTAKKAGHKVEEVSTNGTTTTYKCPRCSRYMVRHSHASVWLPT